MSIDEHGPRSSAVSHACPRPAWAKDMFLEFQPKTAAGVVVGAEALLRCVNPTFGYVSPAKVIAFAERSGAIAVLGNWVLDRACFSLRKWRDEGNTAWTVAVNVSALQLNDADFFNKVWCALGEHEIPAHCLILEITESHVADISEQGLHLLSQLLSMGVQIAMDDFGTGKSSLARLKRLPLTEIKIAREFVVDIDRNDVDVAIVSSILTIASAMGLRVVAEGVERQEQLATLEILGCDQTQGFLHGHPVSDIEFLKRFGTVKIG
ncbi:EAL domain-containing protein [Stenotrophomonas maltophilia]